MDILFLKADETNWFDSTVLISEILIDSIKLLLRNNCIVDENQIGPGKKVLAFSSEFGDIFEEWR